MLESIIEFQKAGGRVGIYTITNIVNNKIYVGQTTDLVERLARHKYHLKLGVHDNRLLQKDFIEFGVDNFKFERLVLVEKQFLISEENYWSNLLLSTDRNFGYNITSTGTGKKSKETKELIRTKALTSSNNMKDKFGELNHRSKPIRQFDLHGNLIKIWGSTRLAEMSLGFRTDGLRDALSTVTKKYKGFIWSR